MYGGGSMAGRVSLSIGVITGFLYAGIAKALPKNRLKWLISLILFPFAFLAIWYSCRYFYVNEADGTVWVLYLVTNIPSGSIIGTMSHSADIQSLLLAVPAVATPLSFFIGILINRGFVYRK
jgi:hypothetical protein